MVSLKEIVSGVELKGRILTQEEFLNNIIGSNDKDELNCSGYAHQKWNRFDRFNRYNHK